MTNERAVEILNLDLDILGQYGDETAEAYKMAIKALEQQPSEDCISREAVRKILVEAKEYGSWDDSSQINRQDALDYVDMLPSVIPKYTDEEIDKAQAVEQAYVDKMVELAVEEAKRPKGKWIEVEVRNVYATLKCSVCGRVIEPIFDFCKYSYEDIKRSYPYCHCGAYMKGKENED